jgi:hypothetical protein
LNLSIILIFESCYLYVQPTFASSTTCFYVSSLTLVLFFLLFMFFAFVCMCLCLETFFVSKTTMNILFVVTIRSLVVFLFQSTCHIWCYNEFFICCDYKISNVFLFFSMNTRWWWWWWWFSFSLSISFAHVLMWNIIFFVFYWS